MPSATFINRLPAELKIDWSNRGGAGPTLETRVCRPGEAITFQHPAGANIDYGLSVRREVGEPWVKFDQDYVSLWENRRGDIKTVEHPAVKWNTVHWSLNFPADPHSASSLTLAPLDSDHFRDYAKDLERR